MHKQTLGNKFLVDPNKFDRPKNVWPIFEDRLTKFFWSISIAANLTEAGPTIFIDGTHHGHLDGACWDGGDGFMPADCEFNLLDTLCNKAASNGHALPAGCQHA